MGWGVWVGGRNLDILVVGPQQVDQTTQAALLDDPRLPQMGVKGLRFRVEGLGVGFGRGVEDRVEGV